jgi:predicted RND superfamily exporter protein
MSTTAKARTARRATSNRPPRSTARPGRGTSAKAVPQSRLVLAVRRSHLLFLVAAALTGLAVAGVRLVQTDARADLLIDPSSSAYADQQLYANTFGADPVVVVLQPQPGQQLLTPQHMTAFATLEGKLAAVHGVKRVYGPGTLVNTLAVEITRRGIETCATQAHGSEQQAIQQAAAAGKSQADQNAAGQAAFDAAARSCAQDFAKQYPNMGIPAVNNPGFF